MRNKIFLLFFLLPGAIPGFSQEPVQKPIRIVDSLSARERTSRNPVILRTELDSLIRIYQVIPEQTEKEPVVQKSEWEKQFILPGLLIIILLIALLLWQFYRQQQKINRYIAGTREKQPVPNGLVNATRERKPTHGTNLPADHFVEIDAELRKLAKENEGLQRVINEYNGIQHEYDSLRHGLLKAYKVKNYPGYAKEKDQTLLMQAVFDTEAAVAKYAFEKFLKPVLAITDANKNNPAKLSGSDQEKIVELLISLSLFYIEYLYLRVNELAIGGKMVERIQGFSKGNGIDTTLLKTLNTEHGSRALVVKMALNKIVPGKLSYPVFDETNLNHA